MNAPVLAAEPTAGAAVDREQLDDLESAEDFLEFFAVPYAPAVVHVYRLHILQRFHNYLAQSRASGEGRSIDAASYADYRRCLARAYADFVSSDAMTEKVFRVQQRAAGITTIALSAIGRARR